MLPVGALYFYQAHFGRTVLPKWPFWAHLFYPVFYSVSELRRPYFRQARVARAVLPPGALFRAGAFALAPCASKSHMRPLPHLGLSEKKEGKFIRAALCPHENSGASPLSKESARGICPRHLAGSSQRRVGCRDVPQLVITPVLHKHFSRKN